MLPTKFRFIWPSGFRGEDFFKSANQKQELPVVAMFVNGRDEMSNLYIRPSIDASYKISDQLALWFQRRRLKCEKLTDDGRGHIFRFPSVAFIYRFDCTKYKGFPCLPFSGYLYMYCSPGYLYRYCSPLQ